MTVYVIFTGDSYGEPSIYGIFSTKEKAEAAGEEYRSLGGNWQQRGDIWREDAEYWMMIEKHEVK